MHKQSSFPQQAHRQAQELLKVVSGGSLTLITRCAQIYNTPEESHTDVHGSPPHEAIHGQDKNFILARRIQSSSLYSQTLHYLSPSGANVRLN
jgi:hypothetical protein